MSWLSGWKYRKQLPVSRPSGAVTDYQIRIELGRNSDCYKDSYSFMQEWYTQPYTVSATTVNSVSNSILNITSTSTDPWIEMYSLGSFNPTVYTHVVMKYRVVSGYGSYTDVFFLNSRRPAANADQRIQGLLNNDGNWHTMVINGSDHQYWNDSNITGFRFDYTNTSGHRLEIDYIGLVGLAGSHCENHCLESFNDIRFTNASGTILNYWIDKIYGEPPNLTATIWVKFDSIGTSDTSFYMYYGNEEAPSVSNGSNTFIKFEDFEWGSDGMDLTTSSGSVTWSRSGTPPATISTEKYYKGTRSGKLTGATSHTNYYFLQELTDNIAFSVWFYKETAVLNGPNFGIGNVAGTKYAGFWVDNNELVNDANNVSTGYYITPDVWQKIECYNVDLNANTYTIKINNSAVKPGANMSPTGGPTFRFLNASTTVGHDVWGDEIIVRHYRSVEPVVGTFGAEELGSVGTTSWGKFIYKQTDAKKIYLGNYLVYEQAQP
jgi:hypothetical protein